MKWLAGQKPKSQHEQTCTWLHQCRMGLKPTSGPLKVGTRRHKLRWCHLSRLDKIGARLRLFLSFTVCLLASRSEGEKKNTLLCRAGFVSLPIISPFLPPKFFFFFFYVRLWLAGAPTGGRTSELLCWMEVAFAAAQLQKSKESLCHFSAGCKQSSWMSDSPSTFFLFCFVLFFSCVSPHTQLVLFGSQSFINVQNRHVWFAIHCVQSYRAGAAAAASSRVHDTQRGDWKRVNCCLREQRET